MNPTKPRLALLKASRGDGVMIMSYKGLSVVNAVGVNINTTVEASDYIAVESVSAVESSSMMR